MSRTPRLTVLLLFLLVLPHRLPADDWVPITSQQPKPPELVVVADDSREIVLRVAVPGYWRGEVDVDGTMHPVYSLPDGVHLREAGCPELPCIAQAVRIADQGEVTVAVEQAETTMVRVPRYLPSKGHFPRSISPATVPYTFSDVYRTDAPYPERAASVEDPFILRRVRGTVLRICPFQYNPARGEMTIATSFTLRIRTEGEGGPNPLMQTRTTPDARVFTDLYRQRFLNQPQTAERYTPLAETGNMLVIANDAFHDAMLPFVSWKRRKGIPTTMVRLSDVGTAATQVKACIQDHYDNAGVAFVVLVGDAAQMPYPTGTAGDVVGQAADPRYALLAGTDSYPDAFVSRFPAQTVAEVQNMVNRVVNYERTPMAGAAWYHLGCGIASDEGTPTDYARMDLLRADLLGFTYTAVDQIYDPGATAAQVSAALNAGRSIVNYLGHGNETKWGTTDFSTAQIGALANTNMLPFVFDVACLNGRFDWTGGNCFAEAFLKAGSAAAPRGAIAIYASSTNQDWVPPCVAQAEAIDRLVAQSDHTVGALCFNGVMKAMDSYPGTTATQLFEQWHIFGDCSLDLFTDTPTAMVVSHPATVGLADPTVLAVTADSGATVCLYSEEAGVHQTQVSVAGTASFWFTPLGTGTIQVTATMPNRLPYEGTVLLQDTALPTIAVAPSSLSATCLLADPLPDLSFTVRNTGAGTLAYWVTDDAAWLSCTPLYGTSTGEEGTITVACDTSGLPVGTHAATIMITDANAANSPLAIPVALTIAAPTFPVLAEDFSAGLPGNWTVVDGLDDAYTWTSANPGEWSSPYWTPPFMIVDSDLAGTVNMDEQLITPSLDCSGCSEVRLTFGHEFWTYAGIDKADVDVRIGGGAWQNVARYTGENAAGYVEIDLTALAAGQSDVQIRWHYYDVFWEWWWGIDDVQVVGTDISPPTVTAIDPANGSGIVPGTVAVDVTFSEQVTGADDPNHLELAGSAAASAAVGIPVHQGGNTWRFPISGLAEGTLDIRLAPDPDQIEDRAGNDLDPSPTTWSYSVGPPSAQPTGLDLDAGSDSGTSDTDNTTNLDNSTPERALDFLVSGTVPGATVTLYADNVAIGSAVADGTTTAVRTDGGTDLPDGGRTITARQTEAGFAASPESPPLPVVIDTVPPAGICEVTPNPRLFPVTQATLVFAEPVAGLADATSLSLTRDGGADLLGGTEPVSTSDGQTFILDGLGALTATAGTYRLALAAGGSAIADAAGNPLVADVVAQWTMAAKTLALDLPAQVTEGDGVLLGTVGIPGAFDADLIVSLTADKPKATVPASVTIPAGQTTASVPVDIGDDDDCDGTQTVTVAATAPGFAAGTAALDVADNDAHHLAVSTGTSPQIRNAPFPITIVAQDVNGLTVATYTGTCTLAATSDAGPTPIAPTTTTPFVAGQWTGMVTLSEFATQVVIAADDGTGIGGTSEAFDVTFGPLHHFAWDTIPSPRYATEPFAVTVAAKDEWENTVADFAGTVALAGGGEGGPNTVAPTTSPAFVGGQWAGEISVANPDTGVALSATDAAAARADGHVGVSNAFDVVPIPGVIEVTDSILPDSDLAMPFGDVIVGLSRTEQITIRNTDPEHDLVVSAIGGIATDPGQQYAEDFDDGIAQDWTPSNAPDWQVVGGEYQADSVAWESLVSTYGGREWTDVTMQATCTYNDWGGPASGILLRASPDAADGFGSAYGFFVYGTYYGVWKQVDGVFSWLQEAVATPALTGDVNTLTATASGGTLQFSINGILVWNGFDGDLTGGRIGLVGLRSDLLLPPPVPPGFELSTVHRFDNVLAGPPEIPPAEWVPEPQPGDDGEELPPRRSGLLLAGESSFAMSGLPALPATVPPLGQVSFAVSFCPASLGDDSATIAIETNDRDHPTVEVQLSGTRIADYLAVTPDQPFAASGHPGGPFSPVATDYVLANDGPVPIEWTAAGTANWLEATPSAGTLAVGQTATVTVGVAAPASELPVGTYTDTITFTNLTTGLADNTRNVTLTVFTSPTILIAPAQFSVCVIQGTTETGTLRITNAADADADLDVVLTAQEIVYGLGNSEQRTRTDAPAWLTLAPAQGTAIVPGDSLDIELGFLADGLSLGTYEAVVVIATNDVANGAVEVPVKMHVDADPMRVVPSTGLAASGSSMQWFAPASMEYELTNSTEEPVEWSSLTTEAWLRATPSGGTLAAGETVAVTVEIAPQAHLLPVGSHAAQVVFENTTCGTVQTRDATLAVAPGTGAARMPFLEDFESGQPLAACWSVTGTNQYRTQVTTANTPHAGTRHLTMDSSVNQNFSRNELTLTIDLADCCNVQLSFWAREYGDEPHGPPTTPFVDGADFDGVAISEDGTTWYEAQPLRTLTATYQQLTVDLDAAIAQHGLTYNGTFRIRFNQYDDYQITSDGIGLDDIAVTGDSRTAMVVLPHASFAAVGYEGGPFDPAARSYLVANGGDTPLSWTLATTATWLDLASSGGILDAGASAEIRISVNANADALAPGVYAETVVFADADTGATVERAVELLVKEFPAPPSEPANPSPEHLATGVALDAQLSWDNPAATRSGTAAPLLGTDATTYDVYFGTESPPAALVLEGTGTTAFDPGTLSPLTTYYWRVVAKNPAGTAMGPEWRFDTVGIGEIVVADSILPGNDLAMPFADTVVGLSRAEQVAITNTDAEHELTITDIRVASSAASAVPGPALRIALPAVAAADPPTAATFSGKRASAARPAGELVVPAGYPALADEIDILILACSDAESDVSILRAALAAFPDIGAVDVFLSSAASPTLGDLAPYAVVVAVSNTGYADATATGDALADYVDGGGKVIQAVATFATGGGWMLAGRFVSEGYGPFVHGTADFSPHALGDFDADHPIMAGVATLTDELCAGVALQPDAKWVASWSNGTPLVGTQGKSVVGINVFPFDGASAGGDFALLFHNAAAWLLSTGFRLEGLPPLPATIPPLGQVAFDVVFEPTSLGEQAAILSIESNDLDEPAVEVQLSGTGIADYLAVTPDQTLASSGHPGGPFTPESIQYELTNGGAEPIEWAAVTTQPWLDADPWIDTLAPGQTVTVTLGLTAIADWMAEGTYADTVTFINLTTGLNVDTREATLTILREPEIVVAPDALEATLPMGGTMTQSIHIGNAPTADANLEFVVRTQATAGGEPAATAVTTTAATAETIVLEYTFAPPRIDRGESHDSVSVAGLEQYLRTGAPIVPVRPATLLVPRGKKVVDARVTLLAQDTLPGAYRLPPAPRPHPLSRPELSRAAAPDPAVYDRDALWPESDFATVGGDPQKTARGPEAYQLFSKRGFQLLALNLFPVRHNPRTGEIRWAGRMRLEVTLADAEREAAIRPSDQIRRSLARRVDNPEAMASYPAADAPAAGGRSQRLPAGGPYQYVVVTSEALAGAPGPWNFQALRDARTAGGIPATIVTTEWIRANYDGTRPDGGSDDQTRIRNFLLDAYQNWGTEYALLGGTNAIVPARMFWVQAFAGEETTMPVDMYYGCLEPAACTFDDDADGIYGEPSDGVGGADVDLCAEISVGRAAVEDADELANFVRKTLAYAGTEAEYLPRITMLGEYLGFEGVSDYAKGMMEQIRLGGDYDGYFTTGFANHAQSDFRPFDTSANLYDQDADWPASELVGLMNGGTHVFNHLGHANQTYNMKLTTDALSQLTNTDSFFVYSQGCQAGWFDQDDCFAEQITAMDGGAFAVVMNARYGWGSRNSTDGPSQRFARQFWDAALAEDMLELGRANQDSKEDNLWNIGGNCMRWCYYELNLFGDPAQQFRFRDACDWLAIEPYPYAGTLAPGESEEVEITILAGERGPGSYSAQVLVASNDPNRPRVAVPVTLHILPDHLGVAPEEAFATTGTRGGPFAPESRDYTLTNSGDAAIEWEATCAEAWLDVQPASGTLPPGESATVSVAINSAANPLPAGSWNSQVTFRNLDTGIGHARAVVLDVAELPPEQGTETVLHSFPLDSDPGWTTQGDWGFGLPQGNSGDPASGHTGSNVYGYNLAGAYANSMPVYCLTTTALDCSGYQNVTLAFWRWLGVENSSFDHAAVEASNDGTNWSQVWTHSGGSVQDTSWQEMTYDISAVADNQPTVYIRWSMGPTDSSVTYFGWNIDDITLSGCLQDDLLVVPMAGLAASGQVGGPFQPDSETFRLVNVGQASIDWTAAKTQAWIDLSQSAGTLPPGETCLLAVSLNAGAEELPPGLHEDLLAIANLTSGAQHTRPVRLRVTEMAGHIEVADSILPGDDLAMPFADTIVSLTRTEQVAITNTDAEHDLTITDIRVARAANSTVSGPALRIALPAVADGDPPTAATFSGARAAAARPAGELVVPAGYPALADETDILILACTTAVSDVSILRAALAAFPDIGAVDVFLASAASPTLGDLAPYAVVIAVSRNGHVDAAATGDALADYVDGGGKVIQAVATFATGGGWMLDGRFVSEGYGPFVHGAADFSPHALGDFDANHPIMAGVATLTDELCAGVALQPDAEWVASWDDGTPLVGTKGESVVGINVFPFDSGSAGGDFALLFHNAAVWLLSPGFRLEGLPPLPATIPPLGQVAFDVVFEPTSLGELTAILSIESNDLDEPAVEVQLSGTGIADYLAVTPDQALASSGHPGGPFTPESIQYELTNNGAVPIEWAATATEAWLRIEPAGGTLDPAGNAIVSVGFAPAANALTEGVYTDAVTFTDLTTGLATHVRDVTLAVVTAPSITVDPEQIAVAVYPGKTASRTIHIGNAPTADANLEFVVRTQATAGGEPAATAVTTTAATAETIVLEYTFAPPRIDRGESHDSVSVAGLEQYLRTGAPIVPVRPATLLVPRGKKVVDARVTLLAQDTLPGAYRLPPAPRPHPLSRPELSRAAAPDPAVYDRDALWPESDFATVGGDPQKTARGPEAYQLFSKRGFQLLALNLFPVRHNPRTGEIRWAGRMRLEVTLADAEREAAIRPSDQIRRSLARRVDNPEAMASYPAADAPAAGGRSQRLPAGGPYQYVVVTSEALAGAPGPWNFQALRDARTAGGIPATIVTTEWIRANYDGTRPDGGSDDQTRIRNFLLDAYQNWGTEYALLGGTNAIVPARMFWVQAFAGEETTMPVDMYYGCLEPAACTFDDDADGIYGEPSDGVGGADVDLCAEISVGRAAVEDADELANFVRKTLAYAGTEAEYLPRITMLGEYLGFEGVSDYAKGMMEQIRLGGDYDGYFTTGFANHAQSDFRPFDTSANLYDQDADWPASELVGLMNGGTHVFNHLGHANQTYNMKLTTAALSQLTNTDSFFVYSQGCQAGWFDQDDCFAEQITAMDGGAFAVVMNARYGWGSRNSTDGPSQRFARQFWDAALAEDMLELGRANQDSKEDNLWNIGGNCMRWCYYELNLFGDPAQQFRFRDACDWLAIEPYPYAGTLAPGESEEVEITVDPGDLTPGLHEAEVRVASNDPCRPTVVVPVALTVLAVPLVISPADGFAAIGTEGGPFAPASHEYTLTNNATEALPWQLSHGGEGWFRISPESGSLPPGGSATVTVQITTAAASLPAGAHTARILFADQASGTQQPRDISLQISLPLPPERHWFPLDGNPGWTAEGNWEFGVPGAPDGPSGGHTGQNVYAYNLTGDYENDMTACSLVTPSLDLSDYSDATLHFWRWLGVEKAPWDEAAIEVSNDGGTTWTPVWTQDGQTIRDTSWQEVAYDISAVADGQADVRIRWRMGPTDPSNTHLGWNIDDIAIRGNLADSLRVGPSEGMDARGLAGGPFDPPAGSYWLTNAGEANLDWTFAGAAWLDATPADGTLAPGETAEVTVSFNETANALAAGDYREDDGLRFTNQTSGIVHARHVALTVHAVPEASFASPQQSIAEDGETATVTVLLSTAPAFDVSVPFALGGSAALGGGYAIAPDAILVIPAGTTSGQIAVTSHGDLLDEDDKTVVLTMGQPTNAVKGTCAEHTITILDTDPLPWATFAKASQGASETGGAATVTVELSEVSGRDVHIPFVLGGSATEGDDYTVSRDPQILTIPAGAPSADITITFVADALDEDDETILLTMGEPTNAVAGATAVHSVALADDDPLPTVGFATATQEVAEADGVANVTLTVSPVSGKSILVAFSCGGSAEQGDDYALTTASPVTIPPMTASMDIALSLVADGRHEGEETITFALGDVVNATPGSETAHGVRLLDSDPPPTVEFAAASQNADEGAGVVTVTCQLSSESNLDTTVPFALGGTATTGKDCTVDPEQAVVIPAGAISAQIQVTILEDPRNEPPETLVITMGEPQNAQLGDAAVHTLTIEDNDDAPSASFAVASQTHAESVGTMTVAVELSAASGFDVTVPFSLSGTATEGEAGDYTVTPNPLVIPAGQTSGELHVAVNDDGLHEPTDETVILSMDEPAHAAKGEITVHTATIEDNDHAPEIGGTDTVHIDMDEDGAPIPFDLALAAADADGDLLKWTVAIPPTHGTALFDYHDDPEAGNNGWTATGFWHRADGTAQGGAQSWWYGQEETGDYANGEANEGELVSAEFVLGADAQLSFWSWEQTEGTDTEFDTRKVFIREVGDRWQELYQSTDNSAAWHPVGPIDLSAYAGRTVQLKFVFDTVDHADNAYGGWCVDDIAVSSVSSCWASGVAVRYYPDENWHGADSFAVQVDDGLGGTDTVTVNVTVASVNDAPTDILLSNSEIRQSDGDDATVGELTATDVEQGDTHAFALVAGDGDEGNAWFHVQGTQLRANAAAMPAGEYSARVQADDGNGGLHARAFTLTVTDDVAPSLPVDVDAAPDQVAEGSAIGTTVGLTAHAADEPSTPLTYSLIDDADGRFEIDPDTGVVTVANGALLDFEDCAAHEIGVQATDAAGNASHALLHVAVANVAPAAGDCAAETDEETGIAGNLLASCSDPNGATLTVAAVDGDAASVGAPVPGDAGGTFTIQANGDWTFHPGADFQDLGPDDSRDNRRAVHMLGWSRRQRGDADRDRDRAQRRADDHRPGDAQRAGGRRDHHRPGRPPCRRPRQRVPGRVHAERAGRPELQPREHNDPADRRLQRADHRAGEGQRRQCGQPCLRPRPRRGRRQRPAGEHGATQRDWRAHLRPDTHRIAGSLERSGGCGGGRPVRNRDPHALAQISRTFGCQCVRHSGRHRSQLRARPRRRGQLRPGSGDRDGRWRR